MIGVDIVKISRIANIISKFGDRFIKRIFTRYEIKLSNRYNHLSMQVNYFAKRFAAKEAYIKATGGCNAQLSFTDMGIKNNPRGKPVFYLYDKKTDNVEVSLSDDGDYAIAMVIVEKRYNTLDGCCYARERHCFN